MLKLPVELQRLCLTFLDHDADALKALRTTNKQLASLASETLFKVVVLNNDEDSGNRFIALAQSKLPSLIRCIVINTSDDPHYSGGDRHVTDIAESFKEAVGLMHTCQNLDELQIKFAEEVSPFLGRHDKHVAEPNYYRSEILDLIMAVLRQMDSVKALTIKNLQDTHDEDVFESDDFIAVRQRINRLHLLFATEYMSSDPGYSIDLAVQAEGFSHALPNIWLKPMGQQLTHLSLWAGECLWGMWPFVDFRNIPPLSRLKSLSFGNFIILHDWQVDWITAHATTLEELILDDCSIATTLLLTEEQVQANFPDLISLKQTEPKSRVEYFVEVPLRWHTVFERFRNELPRLSRFAFGHGDWNSRMAFEGRYGLASSLHDEIYYMFEDGLGPSPWQPTDEYDFDIDGEDRTVVRPACDEEDGEALRSLLEAVQQRAAARA